MTASRALRHSETRHKILLVDDHPLTRHGMAQLIDQQPDIVVCAQSENAFEALNAIRSSKPALALVDVSLPGRHGLELIKDVRAMFPEVLVLVVSMHDELLYAERALKAGARGYLMKNQGGEKLLEAIRHVLGGGIYVSPNISAKILNDLSNNKRRTSNAEISKLTDREFEIFQLVGQGLTTREISERVHLSAKTVETHRLHIREKLGIRSGPEFIRYAVRWVGTQEFL